MEIILTKPQVDRLAQDTGLLNRYPAMLENIVSEMERMLGSETIRKWVDGTQSAKSAETRLRRNIENVNSTIVSIRRIVAASNSIIEWNRINNSKTM